MGGMASGDIVSTPSDTRFPIGIDVIVRIHDPKRTCELDRALFSLVNQSFHPVHPIIVTQDFSDDALLQLQDVADKHDWEHEQVRPTIVNVKNASGGDLRSRLLNVGLSHARHRFFGVLDFDDYLYGHAYEYLISEAMRDNAAISFGHIVINHVRVFSDHMYILKKVRDGFSGNSFDELLHGNFCPIHSFVVDRAIVDPQDLYFDEGLTRLEDYEFFLRICSKYKTNFKSRSKAVGVYNWRLEGGNSTDFFANAAINDPRNKLEWAKAARRIWRRKCLIRS
jgi:hypothetical protein